MQSTYVKLIFIFFPEKGASVFKTFTTGRKLMGEAVPPFHKKLPAVQLLMI